MMKFEEIVEPVVVKEFKPQEKVRKMAEICDGKVINLIGFGYNLVGFNFRLG